jgi:TrpR-related protein YerC/YecD
MTKKQQYNQALNNLTHTLQLIKPNNLKDFLDDLLTEDEVLDINQRLKIAKSLLSGSTVEDTAKQVKASTKTVSEINQILKYGKGGLNTV